MASTYSTNLALELIGTGEQSGTWGTTTNTNLGTLLEQAVSGYVTQAITDGASANTTITIPNGTTGVARNMFIEMTGALTVSSTSLIVPANKKMYFIFNNTSGGFAVTVKVSGQTGILVPTGKKVVLACNGTDIVEAHTATVGAVTLGSTLGVTGAATLSSTLDVTGIASFAAGSAAAPAITRTGDLDTGVWFPAANALGLSSGGTNAVYIDSSQNVGIGTSTPSTFGKLVVSGAVASSGLETWIQNTTDTGGDNTRYAGLSFSVGSDNGTSAIRVYRTNSASDYSTNMTFWTKGAGATATSPTQRMTLDASGNLGIGTTSPVAKLQIKGSGTSGQVTASFILENSSSGTVGMDITGSAGASRWRILRGGNPSTGTNALTEAMCILTEGANAGFVGIGTTSPTVALEVAGAGRFTSGNVTIAPSTATSAAVYIATNTGGTFFAGLDNSTGGTFGLGNYTSVVYNGANTPLVFLTNATERARITAAGELLVGTTSAASASVSAGFQVQYLSGAGTIVNIGHPSSSGSGYSYLLFSYNNGIIGSVGQSGTTAVVYNTTSDYRLKNVIGAVLGAGERIDALKPINYTWKSDNSQTSGFLAHEFETVYPNSVTGIKDAVDTNGKPVYQQMQASTSEVIADLVAEIQSLRTRLTALEAN